jgi:three-Cys-motif partner protein
MTTNVFFDESKDQSKVKSTLVSKYFKAWAMVIVGTMKKPGYRGSNRIAYLDLFAGPGRYKDGTKSTPLMVLEIAIQEPDLRDKLVCIFNDKDKDNTQDLQKAIEELPGIETMKYKPEMRSQEVGEEMVKMFGATSLVPTLFFVDPWGYKGLSLKLVNSVLKDWGCDCVFFFNYNRISMGLTNEYVKEHMDALFGEERADSLRARLNSVEAGERESAIIEELCQALKEMGGKFVLPFRFKNESGSRTSHHLVFVSKHFRGYEIMKEIMANESSVSHQGVPSFEYSPATERYPLLHGFLRPLDGLADMLLADFAGQELPMREIYERHSVDRPFIKRNYKQVLMKLEEEGRITAPKHRRGTFGDDVLARFPAKGA